MSQGAAAGKYFEVPPQVHLVGLGLRISQDSVLGPQAHGLSQVTPIGHVI